MKARGKWALAILWLMLGGHALAQTGGGGAALYRSAAEFVAPAAPSPEGTPSIRLRNRWNSIVLEDAAGRRIIHKDSLFGYRLHDGRTYRWDSDCGREFEIVECGTLIIYRAYDQQYGRKGITPVPVLYFSRTLDSEVRALNSHNLKAEFPGNKELHLLLSQMSSEDMLTRYDSKTKQYLVNVLMANLKH